MVEAFIRKNIIRIRIMRKMLNNENEGYPELKDCRRVITHIIK